MVIYHTGAGLQLKRRPTPSWVSYDNRPVFIVRRTVSGRFSDTFAEITRKLQARDNIMAHQNSWKKIPTVKHLTVVSVDETKGIRIKYEEHRFLGALLAIFQQCRTRLKKSRSLLLILYICVDVNACVMRDKRN